MAIHRNYREAIVSDLDIRAFNKGLSLIEKKRAAKAIPIFKKILKTNDFKEAWLNLGVAYKWVDDYDKVKECFLKAADPKVPFSDGKFSEHYNVALTNLGLLAYTFEHDDIAIQFYKTVLSNDSEDYEALWNLSIASLRQYCSGKEPDLAKCWGYYSYRFKRKGATPLKSDRQDLLLWDCVTTYPEDDLVVLVEQGMGDSFMFGRYIPYAEKYFRKVYVQCTPEMDVLFNNPIRDTADAKYGVPLASLGKMLDHIPAGDWLKEKRIIKVPNGELDIGVVWKGNPDHINDQNRSCMPGYFDRLKKYGTIYTLGPNPSRAGFTHLNGKSWADTIQNLGKLDLIISIDSSVVHCCGSLGMPCWVLMPKLDTDFRWGDSSCGFKNIWYDSVEVFRNPNNWDYVFNNVEMRLAYARDQQSWG